MHSSENTVKLSWADILDTQKNQVTGAGHLQEFKNTELVWKLRKTGFYEGSR